MTKVSELGSQVLTSWISYSALSCLLLQASKQPQTASFSIPVQMGVKHSVFQFRQILELVEDILGIEERGKVAANKKQDGVELQSVLSLSNIIISVLSCL